MNIRPAIWISFAMNLLLGAGLAVLLFVRPPATLVQETEDDPQMPPVPTAMEVPPVVTANHPTPSPFHWEDLSSEDLKIYRDNLRAVGCPALTVRDIILAEINARFQQRRRALLASFQSQFWEIALKGEAAIRTEWGQPLDALAAERQETIADVLGGNYGVAPADAQAQRDIEQQHRSWLTEEKRAELSEIEAEHQSRLEAWSRSLNAQPTAEDRTRLQQLEKQFEDARNELLSPDEREELRLRESRESLWAAGLSGFEPTEEEWRAVTRLRANLEEAQREIGNLPLDDDERLKRQEGLQAQLARDIAVALGDEKYRQYELVGDSRFQDVQKVTARHGLSDHVAVQAYEIQQAALARVQEVRSNPDLSEESRLKTLAAIQKETARTLRTTLGERVFATYQEYIGGWLDDLSR